MFFLFSPFTARIAYRKKKKNKKEKKKRPCINGVTFNKTSRQQQRDIDKSRLIAADPLYAQRSIYIAFSWYIMATDT